MEGKSLILSATSAVISVVATTLQVATNDVLHRVVEERRIIAKKRKTTLDVVCQQHIDTDSIIYLTYVECLRKVEMLGVSYGPWYIKPRSLYWWDQYSDIIMQDDPEKFKSFFRVFVEIFDYICNIVGVHMERNPPPGLKTIAGRWMTSC